MLWPYQDTVIIGSWSQEGFTVSTKHTHKVSNTDTSLRCEVYHDPAVFCTFVIFQVVIVLASVDDT